MNTKTKSTTSKILLIALALVMVLGTLFALPITSSAATNRAGAYYLYGTYDIGDGSKSGYIDEFKIQISTQYFTDDSGTNGTTKYQDATFPWTYFNFYIVATDIDSHVSFKLTRNGSTYTSKSLSGDGNGYLYQGSLSDGDYVLTYVGTYWSGIFSKKTYTFTYKFTVDTTAPSVSLKAGGSTISSGSYTNKAITFTASDSYSTNRVYYLSPSASSYTWTTGSKSVSATSGNNGWWYFYGSDTYQSTSTYKVYLDTVAPVGKITNSSGTTLSSGSYTNKPVKYTATDTGGINYLQVKNPGSSSWTTYSSGTALSSATGWYTFRAVDKAGNISSESKVYYDPTLPTGTLYGGTSVKSSGGYTNASYVKYVPSDSQSGIKNIYVKKPGSSSYVSYTSGTQLTAEGTYYFYCTDNAGNTSSTVSITLDKTAPTGTLYGGAATKSSGSYTNASYVKYTASDSRSGIANVYVKMPGATYYTAYSSGTQLATEGTYSFYCVDKAGNQSSTVTITLDKTKPTGTLYAGSSTATSGSRTNASSVKFTATDAIGLNTIYVKKPGATSYTSYTSGTTLTAEGTYSFYATDKAGNQSDTYTITVDRQIPTAQLYVDGKAVSSGIYTNGDYIKFVCGETCYVKEPGATSFKAYTSGAELNKPGKYVFYGQDAAGNKTSEYSIVIDRTIKQVTVSNVTGGSTNGDVKITWMNGDANSFAPIKSVTVNGKSVSNGTTVYTIDTGNYVVKVVDAAGNEWQTSFKSTKKNVLTDTLVKEFFEATDINGDPFAFTTYEKALEFATARENSKVKTAEWNNSTWDTGIPMDTVDAANAKNGTYFIYYKSGNPDELVAYFTTERLNEVIAEYAKKGIVDYYYWEKTPATAGPNENLYSYSANRNILANEVMLGENIGVTVDGEAFVGSVYNTEGKHVMVISDSYGNTCEYNLTVIRTLPDLYYAIGEGEAVKVDLERTYYVFVEELSDFARIKRGDFVIITLNGVRKYQKQIKRWVRIHNQKIQLVFDESDEISNASGATTKACLDCFRRCRYKLLETGTSTRNNISEFAPQMELLYNNSYNMISWCRDIYHRNKESGELETYGNPYFGEPIPAYKRGYALFSASHLPEKITVFGVGQRTQDIYNADVLSEILGKTVITRTFEEITGKDIRRIHQVPVNFSTPEREIYQQAIERFYEMRWNYFQSTGNSRKDSMAAIMQQILTLLRISAAPSSMSEYVGDTPVKIRKVLSMVEEWENEIVAIGVRHIPVLEEYRKAIEEAFPGRPLFVVTGGNTSFAKRRALRKTLRESGNAILLCTQQSLPSSVNFEYVNKIIIPELHYNNSRMSQFYMRFIRYTSTEWKDIYFVTYAGSIESNLMQMVMAKEKLNLFMKGQDKDLDEIYDKFGVDYDLLSLLMRRETDSEGRLHIRWGQQNIA